MWEGGDEAGSGGDQLDGAADTQFLAQMGDPGAAAAAFGPEGAGTAFALAALGGHAQLKLDLVEVGAAAGSTLDGFVGDSVADANNHGGDEWAADIAHE